MRSIHTCHPFITLSLLSGALLSVVPACGDPGDPLNEGEVITTVTLTFTPEGGGTPVIAEFDDPDGDGGAPPVVDAIELTAGTYTMGVRFENRLEDPPEDITVEVDNESYAHQIFFTGTAVDGPASDQPGAPLVHAYADSDINGLPIGLENSITATAGTGELIVTLRHLPPVNDIAVKTADLAAQAKDGGFAAIGGQTDAQVTFMVTVQ